MRTALVACALLLAAALGAHAATGTLPDGRVVSPVGFTAPVEGFASTAALSPDGKWLAVLCQDANVVDILDASRSVLVDRLSLRSPTGLTWTTDGLYVSGGYTGTVTRYAYVRAAGAARPALSERTPLALSPGLINGIAEDPVTHRLAVARTANHEVALIDDRDGRRLATLAATGEPFAVVFASGALFASVYNSDHVDAWRASTGTAQRIATGPHPTALLAAGDRVFVADADGYDVVVLDARTFALKNRYDLSLAGAPPVPGQTPSGMALSDDGTLLFVAESGFNDVAVIDLLKKQVAARIPAGWYPMSVAFLRGATSGDNDAPKKPQLWITSARGLGSQPDPGGEASGTYAGLVQHLIVEPEFFAVWSQTAAQNNGPAPLVHEKLPPIEHVVLIVRENKQFDEEFGDEPLADADPELLRYGRKYTPNAHALAERFTLFDNFMGDGETAGDGHAWATQGMANDYRERNAHSRAAGQGFDARVAWSMWPVPVAGDDVLAPRVMDADWYLDRADLPHGPRIDTSGVFAPRGELFDELQRRSVSFRVYGEQLTVAAGGKIGPGLAQHAARAYPGAHIDFDVLDTARAQLFVNDLESHGLASFTYLTLPTDRTAGSQPGFYTPAAYIADNDLALGRIVAALSQRPEWERTVIFVTADDPQGTGDHADSHRMPAFAIGPHVRRGYVTHVRYAIPSILRTVELLFGLQPLSIYDARATPMLDVFASTPDTGAFAALPSQVPLTKNPDAR